MLVLGFTGCIAARNAGSTLWTRRSPPNPVSTKGGIAIINIQGAKKITQDMLDKYLTSDSVHSWHPVSGGYFQVTLAKNYETVFYQVVPTLKVLCLHTVVVEESMVEVWTKGNTYDAHDYDDERLSIFTNAGVSKKLDKDFAIMVFKLSDCI